MGFLISSKMESIEKNHHEFCNHTGQYEDQMDMSDMKQEATDNWAIFLTLMSCIALLVFSPVMARYIWRTWKAHEKGSNFEKTQLASETGSAHSARLADE